MRSLLQWRKCPNTCMTDITCINKKGHIDFPYLAGFQGKKIALYAPTLAAAKQTATEHFRPKKRDIGLVWVALAEEAPCPKTN